MFSICCPQVFGSCEAHTLEDLGIPPEKKTAASACEVQDTASAQLSPQHVTGREDTVSSSAETTITSDVIPAKMSEHIDVTPVVEPVCTTEGGNVLTSAASDLVDCEAAATRGTSRDDDCLLPATTILKQLLKTCHSNTTEMLPSSEADPDLVAKRLAGFKRDLDSEVRLKEVFRGTKSTTAKENLLLSLR